MGILRNYVVWVKKLIRCHHLLRLILNQMMFIDHGCKWLLGKKVNQLRGLKDTTNEGNNGLNGFNGSRFGVLAEGEIDVIIVSQAEDPKRLGKDEERKCLAKRKAMDKEEIKV
ncbi:hypothetical protein V6N13_123710 [Hibiscus sabdariffa]